MRSVERDFRLLILAASAGSADGWFFRSVPLAVGILPGLSVLLVAVHGLIYNDRACSRRHDPKDLNS